MFNPLWKNKAEAMKDNDKEGTVSDSVFNDVLDAITGGIYEPGQRLPSENTLREQHGVSRNTIRLVLNKLCALGILETRRGNGTYVRKAGANVPLTQMAPSLVFENHDLASVLEFRKAIEVYAVKLASLRRTDADIRKMRGFLKKMRQTSHAMTQFEKADWDMHLQIAKATGNEMFASMMEIIHNVLTSEMKIMLNKQGRDIDSLFYHGAVVDCIAKQKPDEAAYMMEKHLSLIIERVKTGKTGK